ncbi:MAG: glycosyltransferase, partial [Akkermansiaceae bacterium]
AIEAVSRHPDWTDVEVWQLGGALNKEHAEQAREWEQRDSRYRWFGGLPRNESLALCAKSSLTVNSSILEGGANAVLEAMTMGVPVLASRIEGNLGLLGEGHGGYFDERMDEVLEQVMEDREIPAIWARAAMERLPLFSRDRESRCWLELLEKFS